MNPAAEEMGPPPCKICGAPTRFAFAVPMAKETGHPFPDAPDDCPYWTCQRCEFCFTTAKDQEDHNSIYDLNAYWGDPKDPGRCEQPFRLVTLAAMVGKKKPWEADILDFGCGTGNFIATGRDALALKVWGTDINRPSFGTDHFLPQVDRKFDIIVSCEVVEHLPDPVGTFRMIRGWLKRGGVFAFQTAYYDPRHCDRDWWYIGPKNGHISLYSAKSLDYLFKQLRGSRREMWNRYPGVQAWRF